ncbi:MAG: molybdopterin biosynthesis protein [Firmicutes bacterium]|nr:molybdopterin biosynthesis protein [Bacillota bacterium]
MAQKVYLNSTEYTTIKSILHELIEITNIRLQSEMIDTRDALNRITSEAVYAKVSSPCYNASAMDGIALKASFTFEATESTPVTLSKDQYVFLNTGNQIPEEFDAVVMIEDVIINPDETITLLNSAKEYQHIRPIGEDIVEEDMVLPKNHKIRPIDISALLSAGISTISVMQKPRVAIIPTGDEIVKDVEELVVGKIIDSNSYYVKNELETLGAYTTIFPIEKDDFDRLEQTILQASKAYDFVVIGAGSSAGTKDYAKDIIETNGTVIVHGINIKPGKPTIIGCVNNTPIIGLPGYPVSTYIAFEQVVKPLLYMVQKQEPSLMHFVQARLTRKVYSSLKNYEFVRVKLGKINHEYIATPLDRGAGVTMSLVKADGLLLIDKNSEGFIENQMVTIQLLKNVSEIDKSLISIGSHDILLDKIDGLLSEYNTNLSSSHVGSFGGIMAIKNKGCHIAPVHILGEDGIYNKFIIRQYLDDSYVLVKGVSRIQGLYVKKGNPKQIKSIQDLTRDDVTFVNRQRGSGTRILLDHLLDKSNIDPNKIKGYHFELSTHMLVATSVKDNRYDVGMGVKSAANIVGLDFIEISEEHYDFIVLKDIMNTDIYTNFINVLKSKKFTDEVNKTGGYLVSNIGDVI